MIQNLITINMPTLHRLKKNLQETLIEDLKTALQETKAALAEGSHKYESVNLLLARYVQNQKADIQQEDKNTIRIEYNKIRTSLSHIISDLKEKDLAKAKPSAVLSELERASLEKRSQLLSRKIAKLEERLLRIEGTDATMEFRLEEEIEAAQTRLQALTSKLSTS